MNLDERQLLEDAARAAGIELEYRHGSDAYYYDDNDTGREEWCPLANDGQALRLAVSLRLAVNHYGEGTAVLLPHHSPEGFSTSPAIVEGNSVDHYSATRRAIVRAAAAIGRKMREQP